MSDKNNKKNTNDGFQPPKVTTLVPPKSSNDRLGYAPAKIPPVQKPSQPPLQKPVPQKKGG